MSVKKRFLLRLDPSLYDVLERWAADELRSVNSQIDYLLMEAAKRSRRWQDRARARSPDAGAADQDDT